jgi:hypothetical protein
MKEDPRSSELLLVALAAKSPRTQLGVGFGLMPGQLNGLFTRRCSVARSPLAFVPRAPFHDRCGKSSLRKDGWQLETWQVLTVRKADREKSHAKTSVPDWLSLRIVAR